MGMRGAGLLASALVLAPAAAFAPGGAAACAARRPAAARAAALRPPLPVGMQAAAAAAAAAAPEASRSYGPHIKIKGKVLNWFGAIYVVQALAFGAVWSATMACLSLLYRLTGGKVDPNRRWFDKSGKLWSYVNMKVGGCAPHLITGLENLPDEGTGALFCANHASWFDIPLIAQAVPNTFKFIASKPLGKLPLVGQQLNGGKHVLLDRSSRRGQLSSFKESISWLKKGVGVVAFPEGTRSKTGRLGKFKGGVFSMSTKTGAPIVPITLVGTFEAFPPEALMPLGPVGNILEVHIHPPIAADGKSESQLEDETRAAIVSKLPPQNRPLESL